jgi:hypothetical protein
MFTITADWDAEAGVWTAASDDVPGLAIEAATLDRLTERLTVVVPELLALNGQAADRAFRIEARSD